MYLPAVSIRRPVMAVMMAVAMTVFGVMANFQIGVSLFPDVDFPIITVTTAMPGTDPETVEREVTKRIEDAVATLPGIKHLRSVSAEGISQVFVEFEVGKNVDVAAQDVRDRVGSITREMPADAEAPQIEKLDLDAEPIMAIIVAGSADVRTVTDHAEKLKDRLQQVEGVGSVARIGGREREIRLWLDAAALEAHNLSALEVIHALQAENVEIPAGRIERPGSEIVVKTKGKFERLDQFESLVVAHRENAPIHFSALGHVSDGMEDQRTISKYDGRPAVSLLVRRQSGTNIVAVAEAVKAYLEKIREDEAKAGYRLLVTQDMARFVVHSIDSVKEDVVLGAIFTMLVILFFLRNLRMTFVSVVVIPASLAATVFSIWLLGFTFNNLTMLGFSLAVGIVVDDAIVMLENIYRHVEMGKSRIQAALDGASEIGFAVVVVSFTLIAVFLPVAFMGGMVGQFFFEFGVTVAISIFWSLILSLTLSPMLCATIIKRPSESDRPNALSRSIENGLQWADREYHRILQVVVRRRMLTVGAGLFVLVIAFYASSLFLKSEFIPPEDRGEFQISVSLAAAVGASPTTTSAICDTIEKELRKMPEVREIYQAVGSGGQGQVNQAQIYVGLVDYAHRDAQRDVMERAREILTTLKNAAPGFDRVTTSVGDIQGVSGGGFRNQMIQYNIRGPELDQLSYTAARLKNALAEVDGFTDLDLSVETGKPEISIRIDTARAAELKVATQDIAMTIRTLVGGSNISNFSEKGELFDVRIRLREADRQSLEDILALPVRAQTGHLIRLANVVIIDREAGPVQIDRQARQRQITVLANLGKRQDDTTPTLGEGVDAVNAIVDSIDLLPAGYLGAHTGFAEMMEESFRSIFFTMFLATLVIYILLSSQFNSFVHPFTIMVSVPLAIAGALFALMIAQATLNIITLLGILMLFGLVAKNAIILIDFINQKRAEGLSRDAAILAAGPLRLRPILMTAVSTVAGMVPVAFFGGEGSEVRSPMAIAVMGGMILSTGLTLLVVPAVYSMLDQVAKNPLTLAIRRFISPPDAIDAAAAAADATDAAPAIAHPRATAERTAEPAVNPMPSAIPSATAKSPERRRRSVSGWEWATASSESGLGSGSNEMQPPMAVMLPTSSDTTMVPLSVFAPSIDPNWLDFSTGEAVGPIGAESGAGNQPSTVDPRLLETTIDPPNPSDRPNPPSA